MSNVSAQFNIYHLQNVTINVNSFNNTNTRVANALNRNTNNFGKFYILFKCFDTDNFSGSNTSVR